MGLFSPRKNIELDDLLTHYRIMLQCMPQSNKYRSAQQCIQRLAFDWRHTLRNKPQSLYQVDDRERTFLHYLAAAGLSQFFTENNFSYRFRRKAPADDYRPIQFPDANGLTPYHYAALNGQMSTLKVMTTLYKQYKDDNDMCTTRVGCTVEDILRYRVLMLYERHGLPDRAPSMLNAGLIELINLVDKVQQSFGVEPFRSMPSPESIAALEAWSLADCDQRLRAACSPCA